MESPTSETLNAVTFLAPDTGWAAGEGGQILHWNGATWSVAREFEPALKGSGNYLIWRAIAFSGPDDGWVIGDESSEGGGVAYVMHWNNNEWVDPAPPTPYDYYSAPPYLWDVIAFSPQDVWAVGESRRGGLTLHWDGTEWNPTANPFDSADLGSYWLYDISALAPDNLWVAGTKLEGSGGTDKTVVLRWNGEAWIDMKLSRSGWANAILMLSDDDGWVGGDELFHWNGREWEKAAKPTAEWDRIFDIQASLDGEVWAITQLGAFLHLETLAEVVTKSLTTSSLESGAHYPVWLGAAETKGETR